MRCMCATDVQPRLWTVRYLRKHGAGGCRTSPTCAFSVVWLIRRCRIKVGRRGVKCLFLEYCEDTKAYRLTCLEIKKIIKNMNAVFLKDKTHLEDSPSGRVDEAPAVKVDIFPKLDMEYLNASSNVAEQDEEPDMKEDAEANVPAVKSTRSGGHQKLTTVRELQLNHLQHRNMAIKLLRTSP